MEIEEMQKLREEIEAELTGTIFRAVQRFQKESKMKVTDIVVELVDTSTCDGPQESTVNRVRLEVSM